MKKVTFWGEVMKDLPFTLAATVIFVVLVMWLCPPAFLILMLPPALIGPIMATMGNARQKVDSYKAIRRN